ncbi:hypothetical protein BY458DRAFT_495489, partial [Sporodiniella umbellata]
MSLHFNTVEEFLAKAGFKSLDETYDFIIKIPKKKNIEKKQQDEKDEIIKDLNKTIISLRESIELLKSEKEEKYNDENEIKDLEIKKLKKEFKDYKKNLIKEKEINIKENKEYKKLQDQVNEMKKERESSESSVSHIKDTEEYKLLLNKNNKLENDLKDLNERVNTSVTEVVKSKEIQIEDSIPLEKINRVAFARYILKTKIKEKGESYARQCFRRQNVTKLKCCFEYHEVIISPISVDILDTSSEDGKNVNLFKKYSEKTLNTIQ